MKRYIFVLLCIFSNLSCFSQNDLFTSNLAKYINGEEELYEAVKGDTIIITLTNRELLDDFYNLNTKDTLWFKDKFRGKANVIKGKHYILVDEYKALSAAKQSSYCEWTFRTPFNVINGEKFIVLGGKSNDEIYLRSLEYNDDILWDIDYINKLVGKIYIPAVDREFKKEFIGKTLYRHKQYSSRESSSNYQKVTVVNCEYSICPKYFSEILTLQVIDSTNTKFNEVYSTKQTSLISESKYKDIVKAELEAKKKKGKYNYTLYEVDKPQNSQIRYGKTTTTPSEDNLSKYLYEDNIVSILWYGTKTQFVFNLTNKSSSSIKVVWDDAVFIDNNNSATGILHKGVKYSEVNAPQTPTVIPKGISIEDLIAPKNRIHYSSYSGWMSLEMIDKSWQYHKELDGALIKVLLPIEIKGIINEYTFTFKMKWSWDYPELR